MIPLLKPIATCDKGVVAPEPTSIDGVLLPPFVSLIIASAFRFARLAARACSADMSFVDKMRYLPAND